MGLNYEDPANVLNITPLYITPPPPSQWSSLYNEKPPDNYEDPADVRAIAYAKENMGDFKLKSSSDYVVPDHMRMNTKKARARLLEIKELVCESSSEILLWISY